jgi:hypothetical protein
MTTTIQYAALESYHATAPAAIRLPTALKSRDRVFQVQ